MCPTQSAPDLRWKADDDGLVIYSDRPIEMPLNKDEEAANTVSAPPVWQAVQELWEEEIASETSPGRWEIPWDKFFKAPEETLELLRIPRAPEVSTRVRVAGIPGRHSLELVVETDSISHGRLEGGMPRKGPFYLPAGEAPFLIEESLYRLLKRSSEGPAGDSMEDHLTFLAHSKQEALACGAELDDYLKREEYYFPSELEVDVRVDSPDELTIEPSLKAEEAPSLLQDRRLGKVPRPVESLIKGSRRQRMVFSDQFREQVTGVKERETIQGSDVPRFAENPEAYLPEGIDLSNFSERVRGVRSITYNSRPYLHVRESSGGWFEGVPGINLESLGDEDPTSAAGGEEKLPQGLSPETYRELAERAKETGDEYQRFEGGWVRIDPQQSEEFLGAIDDLGGIQDGVIRAPRSAILDIYENLEALEFDLPPIDEIGLPIPLELPDAVVPGSFNGSLRPYQMLGFRWMTNLDQKSTGGLLADDMGLGKTVQVIAHMSNLAEAGELRPTLIVCPKTLIPNWKREIQRFFPQLSRVSELTRPHVPAEYLREQDVVIASYDTVRRGQLEIAKVDWQCVIGDEAQYAKNPTAQRTSALKALKSKHRVALTGTPVENGLIEFWCIMDFVRPGLLGSWKEFRDRFERPLTNVSTEEERQPLVQELLEHLGPHYLRRLKDEVLTDLPAKTEHRYEAPLSESQLAAYRRIASTARAGGRGAALAAITHLLMICGHPHALDGGMSSYIPRDCPKLDQTVEILKSVQAIGEKALVFTRFKGLQRLLQQTIREVFGIWPDIINGELTRNRQQVIDIFEEKPGFNVLVLSQEVGGVGLNLVGANHVIHYTRPWNPAKENQATDRVYRIGQERPVSVHIPIISHPEFVTVEQRLDELLRDKSQLARDVLRPSSESTIRPEDLLECVDAALS